MQPFANQTPGRRDLLRDGCSSGNFGIYLVFVIKKEQNKRQNTEQLKLRKVAYNTGLIVII